MYIIIIYFIFTVLSQPKKPSTPQNDGSSPKYFKTMTDKMTTTGEFRGSKFKCIIIAIIYMYI